MSPGAAAGWIEVEVRRNVQEINQKAFQSYEKKGYIISNEDFDKWKQISNYENIKNTYFNKAYIDKKIIIDHLIYHIEKKNYNYKDLKMIKIKEISSLSQLCKYLQSDSLILFNEYTKFSFIKNNLFFNKKIEYKLFENTINIFFDKTISFQSNNNIISNNYKLESIVDTNNNLMHLNQLIKIYLFQEEIIKKINSPHCPIKNSNNNYDLMNKIYLVNKTVMDSYKNYFEFDKLYKILKVYLNTMKIQYENLELYFQDIINYIGKNDETYLYNLKKKHNNINTNLNLNQYSSGFKINYINFNSKQLQYINNFEIINIDIYDFFIEKQLIYHNSFIEGKYISGDGKILIIFSNYNQKFYEIGNFNDNNEFIIEYILEEYNNAYNISIFYYFNKNGFNFIEENKYKEISQNILYNEQTPFLYYYKIAKKEDISKKFPEDNYSKLRGTEDFNFIKNILAILVTLHLFENNIKTAISSSFQASNNNILNGENNTRINNCYLINKQFLSEFKNVFSYKQINLFSELLKNYDELNFEKIIIDEKYQNFINSILKSKEIFKRKLSKEYCFHIIHENYSYLYPKDFDILKASTYIIFLQFLDINSEEMKTYNCDLGFYNGKIIIKPKIDFFFEKYNNLKYFIYIYSVNINQNIEYIPELIYQYENESHRIKHFDDIIIGKNFCESGLSFPFDYNFSLIKIYKENNSYEQLFGESSKEKEDNEKKLNKFIRYALIMNREYLKINNIKNKNNASIFEPLTNSKDEKQFFLINNDYMEKIQSILNYNKIKKILNDNNMNVNLNINDDYKNNNEIEKVKSLLKYDKNSFIYKKYIDETYISSQLKDEHFYILTMKEYESLNESKLYYYNNCKIINNGILNLIKEIDRNINSQKHIIKCYYSQNKLIVKINNENLNIGYIDNNSIYIVENIVYSNYDNYGWNISKILDFIMRKGYNSFKNIIKNNIIHFIIESNLSVKGRIENILEQNNKIHISHRLRALILLSIYNNYIKFDSNNKTNSYEKGFLINRNWLKEYQYEEINLTIMNNKNIILDKVQDIKKYNSYDLELVNDIISQIDISSLLDINQKIKENKITSSPRAENAEILLDGDSKLIIYKNFFIINQEIMDIFKNTFSDSFNPNNIYYFNYENADIITFGQYSQYSIYIGMIHRERYSYNINYILNFQTYNDYSTTRNILTKVNAKDYINDKTIFNINKKRDFISPIISEDKILGCCYKYNLGVDYNACINYINLLNNDIIQKSYNLFYYYQNWKKKINKSNSLNKYIKKENYYLINKNIMSEIKKAYNFEKFLQIPNYSITNNQKKDFLYSLKYLPDEFLTEILNNNHYKIKKTYAREELELPIINVSYYDNSKKDIMLYDNFEIFEKEVIELYIDNIYEMNNCCLECVVSKGKIIINYRNYLNEKQYVLTIGELKNENTYVTEYLLIYQEQYSFYINIEFIGNNLDKFIDESQLINGKGPITIREVEEIGIIIKCNEANNKSNNFINNNNNIFSKNNFFGNNNMNNNFMLNNNFINNNNFMNNNIFVNNNIFMNNNNFKNNNNFINNNNLNNEHNNLNNNNHINNNINKNDEKIIKKKNKDSIYYYEPIKMEGITDIKSYFPLPPLIGLQNIGATCYMNATLQCFCNIRNFVNFFKYHKYALNIFEADKKKLTSSFKLLIEKLWPNNYDDPHLKKDYAPYEFKDKISSMNKLFEGVAANDAKDLVNFIIMTLHEELNKAKNKNNINNNNIILDQRNQMAMFNNFVQNFALKNQSIISDLFYGINCNITKCSGCETESYNYQIFFFIVFPLEEVRKFIVSNNQFNQFNNFNNNMSINVVNIYDCFEFDKKVNFLTGENSMYCNYCKQTCPSSMCTVLTTGPQILILLLNRGKGIEFNVKINFFETLNLSRYVQLPNLGFNYKLIGVITHMGESGMGGHFIAYCLEPISQEWYKYNDSIVTKVKDFQKEVINYAMPYLLFYQKNQ